MKNILFNKFFMFVLACVLLMTSCGVWGLDSKVKYLRLGMTKQEVENVLGTSYRHLEAVSIPEGDLETISYSDNLYGNSYTIRFLNDELIEWFADRSPAPVSHSGHN